MTERSDRSEAGKESSAQILRYTGAVAIGLAIDLLVSLALRQLCGAPLIWASAGGFIVGLTLNYLFFEMWVFETRRISLWRFAKSYISGVIALCIRLGSIWMLNALWVSNRIEIDLAKLMIAMGASFIANFVLVRHILNSRSTTR